MTGYVELSKEVVAERDPEWVVAPSHAGLPEGEPFESTTAFERNQTLVVDENLVSQAGPRVVVPLRTMAEMFHPEAFETENTATPSPTPGASGPGLGAVAALLALLVAVILARR